MFLLVLSLKLVSKILRFLKIGGGTALPGIVIEKYFPNIIKDLTKRYSKIVFITGTNGKTTTQYLIRHILEYCKIKVISNLGGSNLIRGIASTLINETNIFKNNEKSVAVFEVEEATMPILTKVISPNIIVITNIYRDQLDLYGEIYKTREYLLQSLLNSPNSFVILNGDDKNVGSLANNINNKVIFMHFKEMKKHKLKFEISIFKIHRNANYEKIISKNLTLNEDLTFKFDIEYKHHNINDINVNVQGFQNIYCVMASIVTVLQIKNISKKTILQSLSSFKAPFGRGESLKIGNKTVKILLIKNPASFNANLYMLKNVSNLKLLIVINDNLADGRDVSWIWDSEIEMLEERNIGFITISGTRAYDMKLRAKYGGLGNIYIETEKNIPKAIDISLSKLNDNDTLFVLPTYTGMLEVRKNLGNIVKLKEFWER